MTSLAFSNLLHEIAHHLGMDALSQDENGICELILNDQAVIMLKSDEALNRLSLFAPTTGLVDQRDKAIASHLFFSQSINALVNDAPQLSWSDENGLIAFKHLPLNAQSAETVCKEIVTLFEWLTQVPASVNIENEGQRQHSLQSTIWV